MQPVRTMEKLLREIVTPGTYLFSLADLAATLPGHDRANLRFIAGSAVEAGILSRACYGLYMLTGTPRNGLELFHIAAKARAGFFNYISQETVLSDAGFISQIPMSRVTIMSSGSSGLLRCGEFGMIEFTHTKRDLAALSPRLRYDAERRLLRASVEVAWEDLKAARRNLHLVDREALHGHALR